jgi:prolyl oligopeptidase
MNFGRFVPLGLLLWLAASDPTFAERRPVTTDYFGTPVVDPYRYMETPGDPSFAGWLQAESTRTRAVLDALPGRPAVEAAVRAEARDPAPYSPTVVAGLLFFERDDDAGNAAIHVRRLAGGTDRPIVDAGTLGPGKSAGAFAPSPDGSLLAVHVYGPERSSEIWIVRVADSRRIEAPLKDSVFDALDWYSDGRHILYDRLAPGAARSGSSAPAAKVFVHPLGSEQDRDGVVFRWVCPHAASCGTSGVLARDSPLVRANCARRLISSAAFTSA